LRSFPETNKGWLFKRSRGNRAAKLLALLPNPVVDGVVEEGEWDVRADDVTGFVRSAARLCTFCLDSKFPSRIRDMSSGDKMVGPVSEEETIEDEVTEDGRARPT